MKVPDRQFQICMFPSNTAKVILLKVNIKRNSSNYQLDYAICILLWWVQVWLFILLHLKSLTNLCTSQ